MMSIVVAFVLAAALCLALEKVAPLMRLVDLPDHRKQHERPVPLVGGLAVLCGFSAGVAHAGLTYVTYPVAPALGLIFLVGLVDDALGVGALWKLLAQFAALFWLVADTGLALTSIPIPFSLIQNSLGDADVTVTVLVATAILNALNMIDGLDGLAGGCLLIAASTLAAAAAAAGNGQMLSLSLILVGSLIGFLLWNARSPWQKRARVFLGDAGALTVGVLVCWMAFELSLRVSPQRVPVTVVLAPFAVPLTDLVAVSLWRLSEGRSPMAADRRHSHHLLLELGLSHRQVVSVIWGASASVAALSFVAWRAGVAEGYLLGVMAVGSLTHLVWFRKAWRGLHSSRAKL